MATLNAAIREAVEQHRHWMDGAVVVTDGDGNYQAIPGAYLSDASYGGPREVVTTIERDATWGEADPDALTMNEIANIAEMIIESL